MRSLLSGRERDAERARARNRGWDREGRVSVRPGFGSCRGLVLVVGSTSDSANTEQSSLAVSCWTDADGDGSKRRWSLNARPWSQKSGLKLSYATA